VRVTVAGSAVGWVSPRGSREFVQGRRSGRVRGLGSVRGLASEPSPLLEGVGALRRDLLGAPSGALLGAPSGALLGAPSGRLSGLPLAGRGPLGPLQGRLGLLGGPPGAVNRPQRRPQRLGSPAGGVGVDRWGARRLGSCDC
jgi:hypothetical protein